MLSALEKVNHSLSGFLFSSLRRVNLALAIRVLPNNGGAICNVETGKLLWPNKGPVLKTKTERISKDSISFIPDYAMEEFPKKSNGMAKKYRKHFPQINAD